MTHRPLRSLLERPVLLRGIELGRARDALLDLEALRVVGFEVACGDEGLRFLPLGAAQVVPGALAVESPLILLEHDDQAFYRRRGRGFKALLGSSVARGRSVLGDLLDVHLDDAGAIVAVIVAGEDGSRELAADADLTIGGVARDPAA